jgi:DNA mismatch endonuclease, patch repair protein
MTDIVSKKVRSRMMASIKSRDTKPEMMVRRAMHARGLRYRLQAPNLPGRPDIVFPKWKAALFVHGCFWHHHPGCRYATVPASNRDLWSKKFKINMERDISVIKALFDLDWRIGVVWECLTKKTEREIAFDELAAFIRNQSVRSGEWQAFV